MDIGADKRVIDRLRIHARAALVVILVCLMPVLGIAGGLGMAPGMAILGIAAAVLGVTKRGGRTPPGLWSGAVMAFAIWAAASSLWSAHPVPGGTDFLGSGPVKLLLGVVVYLSAAAAIIFTAQRAPRKLQFIALISVGVLVAASLADALSGFGLSLAVDPLKPGADLNRRLHDAEMNVGHGLTMALLLLAPMVVGLATYRATDKTKAAPDRLLPDSPLPDWPLVALGALAAAAVALASWRIGLSVGVIGTFAVLLTLGFARLAPRLAVAGGFALGAVSLMLAPVLARVSAGMDAQAKADLPFSWEHRVEGWSYIGARISEHPLVGHGFDAVRTFDDTLDIRGYDMALVSLHPHNAGLHIWVETGAVGVLLAVLALVGLAQLALDWTGRSRARAMAVAGTTVAAVLVSSVSYGVWQEWWWASLFFAGAMCAVLTREA